MIFQQEKGTKGKVSRKSLVQVVAQWNSKSQEPQKEAHNLTGLWSLNIFCKPARVPTILQINCIQIL